jgi:hypothetical protein
MCSVPLPSGVNPTAVKYIYIKVIKPMKTFNYLGSTTSHMSNDIYNKLQRFQYIREVFGENLNKAIGK